LSPEWQWGLTALSLKFAAGIALISLSRFLHLGGIVVGLLLASLSYSMHFVLGEYLEPTVQRQSRAATAPTPIFAGHFDLHLEAGLMWVASISRLNGRIPFLRTCVNKRAQPPKTCSTGCSVALDWRRSGTEMRTYSAELSRMVDIRVVDRDALPDHDVWPVAFVFVRYGAGSERYETAG
jgi:hypothetical protein